MIQVVEEDNVVEDEMETNIIKPKEKKEVEQKILKKENIEPKTTKNKDVQAPLKKKVVSIASHPNA